MERIEFSSMLVRARETNGCGKNELCRRTGFTFHQLQRIENATNSYNMTIPIKYLSELQSFLVLKTNKKEYAIKSYDDFVKWMTSVRGDKYSQRSLAVAINCSRSAIVNAESGKSILGVDIFLKIIGLIGSQIKIEITNE